MSGKIKRIVNMARNMGWRYMIFRSRYELLRRSGLLKKKFPACPAFKQYITLAEWKQQPCRFFFESRESLTFLRKPDAAMRQAYDHICAGKLLLFNSLPADLGAGYDWVTNPDSGYRYDAHRHWTEIADYSGEAGDIKYVWEKSRFSYLYDIVRYDYHYNDDCAAKVFADILSWIQANPVNCGPNYRCSQEMSLRVINWTFALFYYRNSPALTEEIFTQMQYAIYWQMRHVFDNIDFSRIAVRNNHAVTESLGLYLAGIFYPALPGAAEWKKMGKRWFEEEIKYQVYEDGTYLQFSMNYHRVVVQLMTWGIVLSEKNGERLSDVVYERAKKSVQFLRTCMVDENGWVPNYGANDGALFFKLSSGHFRDYRPQLQALAAALGMDAGCGPSEDTEWYGTGDKQRDKVIIPDGAHSFAVGGYYIIREADTLTFIRCGSHKDRPSQADNLHMDVWYKGENILPDAGSYKYNTDFETLRYFSGTQSHNTVMLDNKDQMLKGGRFIWYYWTQRVSAELKADESECIFQGTVNAFGHVEKGIAHKRTVIKQKGKPVWEVKDEITGAPKDAEMQQLWHVPAGNDMVTIRSKNEQGGEQVPQKRNGWYSSLYGQKEITDEYYFSTTEKIICTSVKIGPTR